MGLAPGAPLRITRKEAATYISKTYFRCSVAALAKYAWQKRGPTYVKRDGVGEALYTVPDLDSWALAFLKAPRPSAQKRKKAA